MKTKKIALCFSVLFSTTTWCMMPGARLAAAVLRNTAKRTHAPYICNSNRSAQMLKKRVNQRWFTTQGLSSRKPNKIDLGLGFILGLSTGILFTTATLGMNSDIM